jgi:streptogramin lyase
VLADGFDGQKLNIPNDLAIDPEGRVWFTDPFYEGAAGPWSLDRSNKELDHDSVYRLDPGADGTFPEGTIHYMVEERLADMAKKARAANKDPDDWDDDGDSDAENDNSEDSPAETRHTYY